MSYRRHVDAVSLFCQCCLNTTQMPCQLMVYWYRMNVLTCRTKVVVMYWTGGSFLQSLAPAIAMDVIRIWSSLYRKCWRNHNQAYGDSFAFLCVYCFSVRLLGANADTVNDLLLLVLYLRRPRHNLAKPCACAVNLAGKFTAPLLKVLIMYWLVIQ